MGSPAKWGSPSHLGPGGRPAVPPSPSAPPPPARVGPFLTRWQLPLGCGLPQRSSGPEDEGRGRLPGGALRRSITPPAGARLPIPTSTLWVSGKGRAWPSCVLGAANAQGPGPAASRAPPPRQRPAEPAGGPPGVPWPLGRTHAGCRGRCDTRRATDLPPGAPPAPPAPTRSEGSVPNPKSEAKPPHLSRDQRTGAGRRRPLLTGVLTLSSPAPSHLGPEARGPHSASAAPLPPPASPPPPVFTCLGPAAVSDWCGGQATHGANGGGTLGGEGRRRRSRAEVGAGTNCRADWGTLRARGGQLAEQGRE
ncbi:hypothetical protein P7K49_009388 [Saguinus oedipus]|uniref:Basic proline-rich protein-like n=1 Tax=Saguinus oedipus TaxID=9490 RepID=A0ABQ9VMY6_SAGOE|nr:hypothetical protein P7K49_009388 [Saguinus oedipus]